VRAVNLVPRDGRRRGGGGGPSLGRLGPVHFVLVALVIVLAYVTVFVVTNNTISERKSQLASLRQQVDTQQAAIARFMAYTQFEKLAQQRAQTVQQLAAGRFDWHGALTDLSKVMPTDASLQSLLATAAPGDSVSGAGGSTASSAVGGGVRGDIDAPAFELKGCASSQDDVARLMSRLRLINDVQRVTLEDSTKPTATSAASAGASPPSAGASSTGCSGNAATFDMVVFFEPQPEASGSTSINTGANG
jgi:Tfp pilus assembly protein PilN